MKILQPNEMDERRERLRLEALAEAESVVLAEALATSNESTSPEEALELAVVWLRSRGSAYSLMVIIEPEEGIPVVISSSQTKAQQYLTLGQAQFEVLLAERDDK